MTHWKLRGPSTLIDGGPIYGCEECRHLVQYRVTPALAPFCSGRELDDGSKQLAAPANVHNPVAMRLVDRQALES
jgi:hypothetical protein